MGTLWAEIQLRTEELPEGSGLQPVASSRWRGNRCVHGHLQRD